LAEVSPNLTRYGLVEEANFFAQAAEVAALRAKTEQLSKKPIEVSIKVLEDFYMTDPISRYSFRQKSLKILITFQFFF